MSAVVAALGAGLAAMVGQLTYGKRQWDSLDGQMRRLIPVVDQASRRIVPMIDADTDAFNDYMVRHGTFTPCLAGNFLYDLAHAASRC